MKNFLKNLSWNTKLYMTIMIMNYKSRLKYHGRREFFHTLGMFLSYAADVFVIWISMRLFNSLGGFNFPEIMFLFSLELFAYSLANSFVWFAGDTYNLIVRGKLDDFLIRPTNLFLLMSAKCFEVGYIGQLAISIILLSVSLANLNLKWGLFEWLLYAVLLINSTLIYVGLTVIPSFMAFWLGNTDKLTAIFRWSFKRVIQYPVSIYPTPIRVFLTIILPYALINYYPTLILLKKLSFLDAVLLLLVLLCVGISVIFIIRGMWMAGLRKYESAGG